MRTSSALLGRAADLEYVRRWALGGSCCSIVAVSNLGKSALLRKLSSENSPRKTSPFVYIDCNQMPERTAHAFFIAAWRSIFDALEQRVGNPPVTETARAIYDRLVPTASPVSPLLEFEQGLHLALEHMPHPLVLCLDEFDEAFQNLEPQLWLNLRAFKDRYGDNLVYVTATERELAHMTQTREQGEFYELLAAHVYFLHFMEAEDIRLFCKQFAEREHVTFSTNDVNFIQENAGGHPGLVQAVCHILGAVTGEPSRDAHQDRVIHQHVQEQLAVDDNVRSECDKIWTDLEPDEREALLHLHSGEANQNALNSLRAKSILVGTPEEPRVFCRLFEDYIRRQKFVQQPNVRGVYVDVDAGAVWVNGRPIEGLTDLEYRLIMFLYGRIDRVCDKYSIVESVWGQDYVDNVDDARIEKLVSRVRQKIEPDPSHPQYLHSLRGRGYKLVR